MLIAIGFQRVNEARAEKFDRAKSMGYRLVSYVSPSATIWPDVPIGENCLIMERNVVQPFARIGDDVIMGPANSIGHHVEIGDHAFLASQVDLSGRVVVEERCFLGANATVRDGVRIRRSSVIGASVVIMKDTAERQVFYAPRPRLLRLPSDKLPRI
jgi:sugar O-acyltransferase (sialic acid O-acetyltransferase NeuD family)